MYINIIKNICYVLSSILFTLLYYPQIKRLIKTNDTKSFSMNYIKITLISYILYMVFLIIEKLYILLISSIINTCCIIYIYYKKKRNIEEKKRIQNELTSIEIK